MLAQALIAEADAFVAQRKDLKLPDGRDRIVRHGHGPYRAIQTGVGPLRFVAPRSATGGEVGAEEKIRFTSSILPNGRGGRRGFDALSPVLYLRGGVDRRLPGALAALGEDAEPLLAVISRLTAEWQADYVLRQARPGAQRVRGDERCAGSDGR